MKNLYILFFLSGVISANAQDSGIITFEEKVRMNIQADDVKQDDMPLIPSEHTSRKLLHFNADASIYIADETDDSPTEIEQQTDGGTIKIKMDKPDEKFYCDLQKKILIEQRDFMSRKFLIENDLAKYDWKLTGNQKTILGYPCMEAVKTEPERKITAWFTSAIPVSSGPLRFAGLPGMILSVDVNNGQITMNATNVTLQPIDNSLLVKPTEGKKVTREQFEKIRAEKQKEMQEQNGGNGNVVIKIRN